MNVFSLFLCTERYFTDIAEFVVARTGSRALLIYGHKYVKDRETSVTINWRCSNFIRYKCRARAITRNVNGVERVKLSNPMHSHLPMFGDDTGSRCPSMHDHE